MAASTLTNTGQCLRCRDCPYERNSAGRCVDCHNLEAHERLAARKIELASLPRCEYCQRRGSFTACGEVLLCGRHLKQARSLAQSCGIAGMFGIPITATMVRNILNRQRRS